MIQKKRIQPIICIRFINFSEFFSRRAKRGDAPKQWHEGMLTASAVGTALYVLFIRTLHPSIPGGDSGIANLFIYSKSE